MKVTRQIKTTVLLFMALWLTSGSAWSQHATKTIQKLAAPSFHGRGYYKNGDGKAAEYIRKQFREIGLQPVNGNYFQPFTFSVNTFPGKMKVTVGNNKLDPGKDYIVSPACPSVKGEFNVIKVGYPLTPSGNFNESDFLLLDKTGLDSNGVAMMDSIARNPPKVKGIIIVEPLKLTWSVSTKVNDQVFIRVLKSAWPEKATRIKLDIESKFIPTYIANNVMGYLPGTLYPDSFIVFTAHYDHLGRMGKKALFAGANDNASGTAMIMDIARWYSAPENRPGLSMLFIAFAAEEAGLIGSKYYTENPPLPLNKIHFLLNLDLMGNGQEGVMVVNGEVHEKEYAIMNRINLERNLVKEVGKRGKAKNSDHYWFSEKGVPAFFLYTQGGSKAYHDIYDVPSSLKLEEYEDVKLLLLEFVKKVTSDK